MPGQGTRSHMPQLKISHIAMKISYAAAKNQYSQRNKQIFFKKDFSAQGILNPESSMLTTDIDAEVLRRDVVNKSERTNVYANYC